MSQPSKEYMERYKAENKERLKALQKERDRRKKEAREADPVAMAEYRKKRREEYLKTRPLARTREEIAAGKRIKRVIPKDHPRVCVDCGTTKPLDEFPRHGPRGRKDFCCTCSALRQKNYKKTYKKKAPKPAQPKVPKAVTPKEKTIDLPKLTWKQKLIADGWRYIGGETDSTEYISVFMRGFVVMYVRGATGMYSTGKCRFGVLFDNSGNSYTQLGKAENRARRLYASAS